MEPVMDTPQVTQICWFPVTAAQPCLVLTDNKRGPFSLSDSWQPLCFFFLLHPVHPEDWSVSSSILKLLFVGVPCYSM